MSNQAVKAVIESNIGKGASGALPPGCDYEQMCMMVNGVMVVPELLPLIQAIASAYNEESENQSKEIENVPAGFTRNEKGHLIPDEQLEEKDVLENALINKSHCLMAAMKAGADTVRIHIHSEADALCSMRIIDAGGSDKSTQEPGQVTLHNMEGTRKLQIDRRATMSLSPEAHAAKELVMKCIKKRAGNVDKLLLDLVSAAWKTNSDGDISVSKVSALFGITCRDIDWMAAMDAIRAAMRGNGVKTYTRLYKRASPNDKWILVEAKV